MSKTSESWGVVMIVGLTGGIATGKSTVAQMFVERGALLVDADQIAREVVEPGSEVLAEIVRFFDQHYRVQLLTVNGELDRKALGELVFSNPQAKRELEDLIHPAIRAKIISRVQSYAEQFPNRLVIADIPLLFESKYDYMFAEVILVYVPRDMQLQRLMARDGLSREQAEQRLAAQMPIEEKRQLASVIIDNRDDLLMTSQQVDNFLRSKGLHEMEH